MKTKAFNPKTLTKAGKNRLEALLSEIETAAKARKEYIDKACLTALDKFLSEPQTDFEHDYIDMNQAIPDNRWKLYYSEIFYQMNINKAAQSLSQVEQLDIDMQRKAIAYMDAKKETYLDITESKAHWNKLSALYKTILSEFPEILTTDNDLKDNLKLGATIIKERGWLETQWKTANDNAKLEKTREILTKAYPEDDINNLHIAKTKIENAFAAIIPSTSADTMILGPKYFKMESYGFPLFLTAHEIQHRRQLKLVEKLEKNLLKENSAEYYQARLFKANFEGGYLTPPTSKGKIRNLASMPDYFDQPVEKQANDNAMSVHHIANTGADRIWEISEKLTRTFSSAAKPIDTALYYSQKITAAIRSIGQKNKPAL